MRGGKKGGFKGRERVMAQNEDDIITRNMIETEERKKKKEEAVDDESKSDNSDANESSSEPEVIVSRRRVVKKDSEDELDDSKNINRGPKGSAPAAGSLKVELSGKQKREMDDQKAKEAYFQRTLEGKTPEAKATLERLAKIRAQREEAAKRRKDEEEARNVTEQRIKEQARLRNQGN